MTNTTGEANPVSTPRDYASSCTETGAPSLTASTFSTSATPPLDPGALAYYNALKTLLQYDPDGNIIGHPNNTHNTSVPIDSYPGQAGLENQLDNWGLDPPSSLAALASNGVQDLCYLPIVSPTDSVTSSTETEAPTTNRLAKRFSFDDFTDYTCDDTINDLVGALNEDIGDAVEATCGINDLVQNQDALKCLFENCYTTKTIITYYTPPPATKYNFDYSWSVDFPPIQRIVAYGIGCVNCGFSISNIEFSGEIIINMTAGTINEAKISKQTTFESRT